MSTLTDLEKRYLEKILNMHQGYVLDYNDASFGSFFKRFGINIHSPKYQTYGGSKAKKMRSFWEQENDRLVGQILDEMLDSYEAACDIDGTKPDLAVLEKARGVVARLTGKKQKGRDSRTVEGFLDQEFTIPNIQSLPIESVIIPIVESRLNEARTALRAGAYLSVIFLCGSILEAVLLGSAQRQCERFNRCPASPKNKEGKVLPFNEWNLAQLIDVASNIGILKIDVKKFSHGLRDFRNYIHPYQQMATGFTPDEHTAKVCFQVLKAALASVSGER